MRKLFARLVLAGLIGSSIPAYASEMQPDVRFNDDQIAELMVFGEGPAVEGNPELAELFKSNNPDNYTPTPAEVAYAVSLLFSHIQNFHEVVTIPLQSGNPLRVKKAILTVSNALHEIVSGVAAEYPYEEQGRIKHDANLLAEINGVAVLNAAVYANAALVVDVAYVLYVTPGAISYQFPLIQNSYAGRKLVSSIAENLHG